MVNRLSESNGRAGVLEIVICDDDVKQLATIQEATERYFALHPERPVRIRTYDNALLLSEDFSKLGACDILLLDIFMPGILGTEIAREIRNRKERTEIVFLTTSSEFAVKAFSLKAAHYIVKPFTQDAFDEALNRVFERLDYLQPKKLRIKLTGSSVQTIDISEIQYIESFSHLQTVHQKDGTLLKARQSMSQFLLDLEQLSPGQFLSPYKGYIVNLAAIRTIEPDQILFHGGKSVPIVKRNYRALKDQYFNYMFGGERDHDL